MLDIFMEFGVIVLDSSLIFASFDSSFLNYLRVYTENGGSLFRCPSYKTEVSELQNAVGDSVREISKSNAQHISEFDVTDVRAKELDGECDCEALIAMLLAQNIEVAIATINKFLIMRLILNDIPVSIIDPTDVTITRPTDFESYKEKSDVLALSPPSPIPCMPVNEGDRLLCGDGNYITLSTVFNAGGKEAVIYYCDRHDVVAKIFKDGILTDVKLENIKNFINFKPSLPWLICPIDILFAQRVDITNDTTENCPVGYLMPKISNVTDVGVEELFLGDIDCLSESKYKEIRPAYVADVCIAILRQIIFLHMNGVLFGDFNGGNFALKNDGSTDFVVFFDTDGYGYKKNPVVSAAAEFENPRIYDLHDKRDMLRSEYDNIYISVFRWMTLGMSPFSKDENGDWKYRDWQKENEQRKARWMLIPNDLQELFDRVFGDGEVRTPTELLFALKNAYKRIVIQEAYSKHFAAFLSNNQQLQLVTPDSKPVSRLAPIPEPSRSITVLLPKTIDSSSSPKAKWPYVLSGIVAVVILGVLVLQFDFGHLGYFPDSDGQAIISSSTSISTSEPELQRYDTDDGYYFSYAGQLDGYVEYYWDNGDIYKGDFNDGVIMGKGEYTFSSGASYSGDFIEGVMSGKGSLYDPQGELIYAGSWKANLFDGEGVYYFPNGAKYNTTWSEGTCKNGNEVNLTNTKTNEPVAKGYWDANIFYGEYYEDGQWYSVP